MDKTNTIELLRHSVNKMSEIMLEIYTAWKNNQTTPPTDCECMAESMYQMMVCKAKNVLLMSEGITLLANSKISISDPSNIYPVVRSMYEMIFIFRCIYVSSKNDIERELLLKIWKIRGNNNLTKIPKSELEKEYQDIQLDKKEENETLRKDIRRLMCEISLSNSIKDCIEDCIKMETPSLKGFKFEHCEHCGSITSFCTLNFNDSSKELTQTSFGYSHFSAHSHPSYLGVEHFWKMYNLNAEDKYLKEVLTHSFLFLGYFMTDFYKYKESYRPFYDQKENQINNLINQIIQDQQKNLWFIRQMHRSYRVEKGF